MRWYALLLGEVRYAVPSDGGAALFSLFKTAHFSPKALKRCEKTQKIRFWIACAEAARFERDASDAGVAFAREAERGLPFLWRRVCRRPGLLVGALLALLLVTASQLFVWEIELSGNSALGKEELEAQLCEAGLYRGAFLPSLDKDAVALLLREADTRISYASVNVNGTVARVQIREEEQPTTPPRSPANLVAARDGVVTMPLIFEGECVVAAGEAVRAGQLLASGISDTQNHGYRLTRAAGQVLARTQHVYTVTVPFSDTVKSYTGREKRSVSVFFFHFERNFFENSGNQTEKYDIMTNNYIAHLPDGRSLPWGASVTTAAEYELLPIRRSAAEARALALSRLGEQLAADSAGRTMLSRVIETSVSEDAITLICTVTCEEDIAQVAEFSTEQ